MMGSEFEPIMPAELADGRLVDQLLPRTWCPYVRWLFLVLAETSRNQSTDFITGVGTLLEQFLFGYSGLHLGANGLEKKYPPVLPSNIRRLTLRGAMRGAHRTFTIRNGSSQ